MNAMIYWIGHLVGQTLDVAIYAMMAACFLPFVFTIIAKLSGGFRPADNANPRAFLAKTTGRAARANAAQANSFESLPMFLAATTVAMYCFVPQDVINSLAWLYVFIRIAYGVAYIINAAMLRSVLWFLSMACIAMLFVLSIRVQGG